MKRNYIILACVAGLMLPPRVQAQAVKIGKGDVNVPNSKPKADPEVKAAQWVAGLNLNDAAKTARLQSVITNHLIAVRDWNNNHDYTLVPEGINPITGKVLNKLERQVIINSTIPKSVHDNLMAGLRKNLTEEQVEQILDKYTIGKVAFTLNVTRL